MTLPENLDVYISALMFVLGAYFIALYIGLIVWTFRDIRSRSRDLLAQIMATLMVAIFTLPGLLIYLLLRPHVTLSEQYERSLTEEAILQDLNDQRVCPSCQHVVEPDYVVCPYCQTQLRLRCVGCGRLTNPDWSVCPYCGLIQQPVSAHEPEVETVENVPSEALAEDSMATMPEKDTYGPVDAMPESDVVWREKDDAADQSTTADTASGFSETIQDEDDDTPAEYA